LKTFQIPAGLDGYRSLKDRTLKLTFETGEMSPEQMANIHYSLNKIGYLAFSPDPFASHELEAIDNLKVEYDEVGKSPSKRLQAVFYRTWEKQTEGYNVFNDFYIAQMEKLIVHFKKKLDP
jgi:hypothetical protein